MEKCDRLFYPKRRRVAKAALEKLMHLPNLKFDVNLQEFDVDLENGVRLTSVNVIDYLCYITDPDPNAYISQVHSDEDGVVFNKKLHTFDCLILATR